VIRKAASDSAGNEVYDKVKENGNKGVWAQVKGGAQTFKGNGNSIGDYKDTSLGLMAGADKYIEDKSMIIGVYAKMNKDNIEQKENRADGSRNGLGVYGGYIKEKYEIKAALLGSYDIFGTERKVLEQKSKADISAITINADIEGSLKYEINEEMKFKPYTGIEIKDTNYGSFKEKGAGVLDLEVSGGSYVRSAARIGAGIEYGKEKLNIYAKAEGKYILSGTEPEIESVFKGTQEKFRSRGAQEGSIEIGIGAGVEIKVRENFSLYANINYYGAEKYSNIYGNIGGRYVFGQVKRERKDSIVILKEKDMIEAWEVIGNKE
jgi:outer membrane autotransporter protein